MTHYQQLLAPLLSRVNARQAFSDRAAEYVLNKLGISMEAAGGGETTSSERRATVNRWSWIDLRAVQFFNLFPNAVGIEIDAGLSTRFHRISDQLDWPRFSWITINSQKATELSNEAFPKTDNFINKESVEPLTGWAECIDWTDKKPKLIIIDRPEELKRSADFHRCCMSVAAYLSKETPFVDVVVSHRIAHFDKVIQSGGNNGCNVTLKNSNQTYSASLLGKFLRGRSANAMDAYVDHIVISRADLEV